MKLKDRPTPGLVDPAQFKSRHNVNDPVIVYFGNSGVIKNCKVIKIHFTEATVSYDVEVKWTHEDQEYQHTDRLYNLHSSIVFNPNDFEDAAPWLWMRKEIDRIYRDSGIRPLALKGGGPEEFWRAEGTFLDAVGKLLKENSNG